MDSIKVIIEPEKELSTAGQKAGKLVKNLEPLILDLPELLRKLQDSACQSIKTKSKLTIQIQASVSVSDSIQPGIQVPIFKLSGSKNNSESGNITLKLETEIEPICI